MRPTQLAYIFQCISVSWFVPRYLTSYYYTVLFYTTVAVRLKPTNNPVKTFFSKSWVRHRSDAWTKRCSNGSPLDNVILHLRGHAGHLLLFRLSSILVLKVCWKKIPANVVYTACSYFLAIANMPRGKRHTSRTKVVRSTLRFVMKAYIHVQSCLYHSETFFNSGKRARD